MNQPANWTDPDAYEIFMGRWSELLAQSFVAFADVTPGGRALDAACGTGVLTKALADTGMQVTGVDASEGYLEGALRRRSHPNIIYEGGDVRQLRFADGRFHTCPGCHS
jgi:2-polyprenyl-3-methyl-5-hydroxy-6-metoxy-1,4-benzoquinol methylase